jgi:preprotein translocase subunit YajC
MKFSYYLEKITGVSVYPIVSLVLFVSFFLLVTFWVMRTDKKTVERMENLPLDIDGV